jgi:glycosyltransferase involved in cell wall biosynthesis
MDKLVTVIVPAWNAEKYLEASLRSVLNQTHRALRVLVIDDGSTDGTAEILARLREEDPRLDFRTVANGGPAAARNRALELLPAGTDYVMFLDADDLLLPDALAYALTGSEGAEITIFGFSIQRPDGSLRDYCEPERLLDRGALGKELPRLYKANLLNQVWAKLYAAPLLEGLRFPDYRWGEDRLFLFDALERAQTVKILPESKHRYVMHEGESLITRYYDKKFHVCCAIDGRVEALGAALGTDAAGEADFRYMFAKSVFSCLTNLYARSCRLSRAEKREIARRIGNDEQVRRRCRDCSGGLPTRLLCAVVRSGRPGLTLFCFRLVAWAGERFPRLFLKLKHRK